MNASRREIQLGAATAVVLLGALTWWMVEDNITAWGELGEKAQTLERMLAKQERNAARKPELIRQLDEIKSLLPVHAEDLDLKPRMLQQLKQAADAQKIVLSSMRPKDEKVAPQTGLSEQSIDCAFEGEFPDWVRFLYDIEAQGPVMAVSKISVRSDQKAGRLKGSLTVDFAYARGIETERKAPVNPGVAPEPRVVDTPAPASAPPPAVTNNVPAVSTNAPSAAPSVPSMPGVPAMPGAPNVETDLPSVNPSSAFPSPGPAANFTKPVAEPLPEFQVNNTLPPMNFQQASLDEVLDQYARYTGRKMVKEEGLEPVKITLVSTRSLPAAQVLLAIEKALGEHKLKLVPGEQGVLRVTAAAPATPARAAPPGVPAFPVPGPPPTNRIIRINRPRPASPMPTLPAPAPSPAPAPPQP